jgi:DNA-binding CsgD family transcriptional regulator
LIIDEGDYIAHYGILRKSGRYPWGSGGSTLSRSRSFLETVDALRKEGMSDPEIARTFHTDEHPFTTTNLRAMKSIAKNEKHSADVGFAVKLKEKGLSNVAIGKQMGIPESSVRGLLSAHLKDKEDILNTTASMLREQVDKKAYIDIGTGVENHLGISSTRLNTAVAMLKEEGYSVVHLKVSQLGTGKQTRIKVLVPPGTDYTEVSRNRHRIQQLQMVSDNGGRSYSPTNQPPKSISAKRVDIVYKEDGGAQADGVIYVRPGVEDVSLGNARYSQVRVLVDGSHYIKGMAIYKDGLPDGVDLQFNTNKSNTGNKKDALKKISDDPENPFGATVRQVTGKDGKVKSAMNLVNEEGDWDKWSKSLSSQFLSKQPHSLAKQQLDVSYERRRNELDAILQLTNPAVRKRLLDSFADDADSAAVHLKAANLPRQASKVILPINSMKETEVFAPTFRDGERVVLIRHPHGGKFELPELTVNNRNMEARRLLGKDNPDAIGIHFKVAERLSGADFDGDSVIVVPNTHGSVKTSPALYGLRGFDPQTQYKEYEGMKPMSTRTKGIEMGKISNLITDMTIKGANSTELAAAVRHSMVVIDAEKHNLDWRRSARENGIPALAEKYQDRRAGRAATLISRAKSRVDVPDRKPRPASEGGPVDPATGRLVFVETRATTPSGKPKMFKSKKLAETDDALTLSSGTPIEKIYGDYSNNLKNLASVARKASVSTKPTPYSPSAKQHYAAEVASLNHKLNLVVRNRPLERQAQLVANTAVAAKRRASPDMADDDVKKLRFRELENARQMVGAEALRVDITPNEWNAIQAGAVTNNTLSQILQKADLKQVRQYATPRTPTVMTNAKQLRAKSMLASGYTLAEVADHLGVAQSTLSSSLNK